VDEGSHNSGDATGRPGDISLPGAQAFRSVDPPLNDGRLTAGQVDSQSLNSCQLRVPEKARSVDIENPRGPDTQVVAGPTRRRGMTRDEARAATIAERRLQGLDTPSSSAVVKQALVELLERAVALRRSARDGRREHSDRGAA
jgi:hypothetical protein